MKSLVGILAVAVAAASPLAAQMEAEAVVGVFDFESVDPDGNPIIGTFTFAHEDGHFSGSMGIQGQQIPFESVSVDGNEVGIIVLVPNVGEATIELEFDGPDAFSGTWVLNMDTGNVTGTRQGMGDSMQ